MSMTTPSVTVPVEPTEEMIEAGILAAWPGPEIVYADEHAGPEFMLAAAFKAMLSARGEVDRPVWFEGAPSQHHAKEWFIAETIFGDRVVLTALPEEYTYDFKTADDTYIKADRIKRWMPFPDSEYLPPSPAPAPEGGAVQWGWRVRAKPSRATSHRPWHWQADEPTETTAELCEWEPVYVSLATREEAPSEDDARRKLIGLIEQWDGESEYDAQDVAALADDILHAFNGPPVVSEEAPAEAGERDKRAWIDRWNAIEAAARDALHTMSELLETPNLKRMQYALGDRRDALRDALSLPEAGTAWMRPAALRAQPPARDGDNDRPIEATWTDGKTHAYVNLSAALSAERKAWRQKLGLRIASVRYLDIETPPAREDAQPVKCPRCYRGEVFGLSMDDGFWVEFSSASGGAHPAGMHGWLELAEHHPDGRMVVREYVAKDSPIYPAPDALRVAAEEVADAVDFFDRVKAATQDEQIAVGRDHWNRLEAAARRLAALQAEQGAK